MVTNTPPMGWNTYNSFGADISEQLIIESCDAMVENGLRDAGYTYINIDDFWSLKERDENGNLVADPQKFPHGIKYVSDYIHSKGMKFGMYSSAGPLTCGGHPGSFEHEFQDAEFFAANGVDYLKYDFCTRPYNVPAWVLYNRMSMALRATGRDILFSACNWGMDNVEDWARSVGCNMYRSTGDIYNHFSSVKSIFECQKDKMHLSAPSCFNDMDMLVAGMSGISETESTTHFALWCMLSQPLILGCDVRNLTEADVALFTNRDLLAINQDPGVRAPIFKNCEMDRYKMIKHLENNEYVFAFANLSDENAASMEIMLPDLGLSVGDGYAFKLYDILTDEDMGVFTDYVIGKDIPPHGIKLFKGTLVKL